MDKNKNLNKAKIKKDDEYYTYLYDIENELKYYKYHLKGKIILMPCDDPELIKTLPEGNCLEDKASKFWVYFHKNFKHLKLKKIIATHYSENENSYMIEYDGKGNDNDIYNFKKTYLNGNGDFRSEEIQKLYDCVDIIITNPPFSLFNEFLINLVDKQKEFLIIGHEMKTTTKTIFRLFQNNKVWYGYNSVKKFLYYDKEKNETFPKFFGNVSWMTNLDIQKRNEEFNLFQKYDSQKHLKYDNIDAINCDKLTEIPYDYKELMGVPSTFLKVYNPNQFEIVALDLDYEKNDYGIDRSYINGKRKFARILIKRK